MCSALGTDPHMANFLHTAQAKQGLGTSSALNELSRRLSMQTESREAAVRQAQQNVAADSVIVLRDRLLQEAWNERQRCLANAEASQRRAEGAQRTCCASTQTDTVIISLPGFGNSSGCATPVSSAGGTTIATSADRQFSSPPPPSMFPGLGTGATSNLSRQSSFCGSVAVRPSGWNQQDDDAQAEAIRTIQLLGQRSNATTQGQADATNARIAQLEEQVRTQREATEIVKAKLVSERSQRESAQQQVLCLEYELDGKESSVQVAERALEKNHLDLHKATMELKVVQECLEQRSQQVLASGSVSQGARVQVMRAQLLDRESQLELKDQHISRLLSVLKQHRSILGEDRLSTPA